MPSRLETYAASLIVDWLAARTGTGWTLASASGEAPPVFIADADGRRLALAVAPLWDAALDPGAEEARATMEERLSGGLVRGPHLLWVPPHASVPDDEPEQSDFVRRTQQAAAPLQPGVRGEVQLPVAIQLAKLRDEGGYASVVGGLGRWWTLITERVNGTFHVNSARMRRAPQSAQLREALFDRIAEVAKPMQTGEAIEFDTFEAWTVQRLAREPLGETGFAIAQAPPALDTTDGTAMRPIVRKRLKAAGAALEGVEADVRGIGVIAIYDYAEHENLGAFVKSLDPALFSRVNLVAAVVDGEVRPIFGPR